MEAKPHPLQAARLAALHRYEILDTEREAEFDDLVKLAAGICEAPISVVNFIDAERQWFKAETGLGTRETPLATSICSHVILEQDFVEIEDTLLDERMADNPLCCGDPGLRFYAGALLRDPQSLPLGTLCVLDYTPRRLTALQRDAIRALANQVMQQLNLRLALRREEMFRAEVDHRVKNSLQAVSSLARLQGAAVSSPEAQAALKTVENHIAAFAALHAELSAPGDDRLVDLDGYLQKVCGLLGDGLPPDIRLTIDVEPAALKARHAIGLAVIINEFTANSIKHAFPNGRKGEIRISGSRLEGDHYALLCEDDGVGRLKGGSRSGGSGLGLKIIEAYSAQLNATADHNPMSTGTAIRLVFPMA